MRARAIVIGTDELRITRKILASVRHLNRDIPVLVRCQDQAELKKLEQLGATECVTEIFEESISLAHHLLYLLKLPETEVARLMHLARSRHYRYLRDTSTSEPADVVEKPKDQRLRALTLLAESFAVGRQLDELNLEDFAVDVISVHPEQGTPTSPDQNPRLKSGDIMTLFGNETQLALAERFLMTGNAP